MKRSPDINRMTLIQFRELACRITNLQAKSQQFHEIHADTPLTPLDTACFQESFVNYCILEMVTQKQNGPL